MSLVDERFGMGPELVRIVDEVDALLAEETKGELLAGLFVCLQEAWDLAQKFTDDLLAEGRDETPKDLIHSCLDRIAQNAVLLNGKLH